MAKLPTLRREIALVLVAAQNDPSGTKTTCAISDELARVFVHNKLTDKDLGDIALSCNEVGQVVLRRAIGKYKKSPAHKAIELSAEELFAQLDDTQENSSDNDPQQEAEAFTEDFPKDDGEWLRKHLRDTYGLNSPQDWMHLKQARHCIAEQRPELRKRTGRKTARTLAKLAFDLYETAKANNCSPVEWVEWKKTKKAISSGQVNPGSIINVPSGGQVWGDGEPVRHDSNGKPRRRAIDIFGKEVADNERPDIDDIDDMMGRAYPQR